MLYMVEVPDFNVHGLVCYTKNFAPIGAGGIIGSFVRFCV